MLYSSNKDLVNALRESGVLRSEKIIEAFLNIDRKDFVKEDYIYEAYGDYPLPIGEGQTISQPWTVAFMLELLEPKKDQKILDVGFGSGWTTTLLAYIVTDKKFSPKEKVDPKDFKGKVYGIEILPSIFNFGKSNIEKYNYIKNGIVELKLGDGSKGWIEKSPFDRILVSAAAQKEIPKPLIDQLENNGILVMPDKNGIWKIMKIEGEIKKEYYQGFSFVPLIEE
ncbi:MAG: protein-L-isoaspartate O-methyltransferase [Minisyncoccia bacterium]